MTTSGLRERSKIRRFSAENPFDKNPSAFQRRLPPRGDGGFSLVELLITTAILALLAGLLLPALGSAREKGRAAMCVSNLRQLHLAATLYANENDDRCVLGAEEFLVNLKRWHGVRTSASQPFDPARGPLVAYLGRSGVIKQCPSLRTPLGGASNDPRFFERGCGGYGYNMTYLGSCPGDWNYTRSVRRSDILHPESTVMFADAGLAYPDGCIEYSFIEPPYWADASGVREDWGSPVPSVHFRHSGRANAVWCDGHVSSESMSRTGGSNVYGGDSARHRLGWFGPLTSNALWRIQ